MRCTPKPQAVCIHSTSILLHLLLLLPKPSTIKSTHPRGSALGHWPYQLVLCRKGQFQGELLGRHLVQLGQVEPQVVLREEAATNTLLDMVVGCSFVGDWLFRIWMIVVLKGKIMPIYYILLYCRLCSSYWLIYHPLSIKCKIHTGYWCVLFLCMWCMCSVSANQCSNGAQTTTITTSLPSFKDLSIHRMSGSRSKPGLNELTTRPPLPCLRESSGMFLRRILRRVARFRWLYNLSHML